MKRRSFIGTLAMALVTMASPFVVTGCNALDDLLSWIPVGLQAVSSILSLLSGAGLLGAGIAATISLIQKGLTALKLAIIEYNSTNPPPVGVLAKIDTFLSDLVTNFGNLLAELPTGTNTIVTLVVGLVELTLSIINGFIQKIPMATSLPKTAAIFKRGMNVNGRALNLVPETNLSRRHFIHTFNSLNNAAGHPEANLPASLVQHL